MFQFEFFIVLCSVRLNMKLVFDIPEDGSLKKSAYIRLSVIITSERNEDIELYMYCSFTVYIKFFFKHVCILAMALLFSQS